jgi:hypothetical protein
MRRYETLKVNLRDDTIEILLTKFVASANAVVSPTVGLVALAIQLVMMKYFNGNISDPPN